jgi:Cys-tRNA(Pro)/Cys-tRNA(Cys) deacylase
MSDATRLPAHAHLDRLGIPYQRRSFPPTTEKGAASVARVLGIEEHQAVKTLIFEVDTGERVLVMVAADRSAISGHLKRAIGSRNIRMADPATVLSVTGYVVGSIPPCHWQPPGFRTLVDDALMAEPILGVGAGQWGEEILLTPAYLVRASGAEVVNLTDRDRPVRPGEG